MDASKTNRLYLLTLIAAIIVWIALNAIWVANSTADPHNDSTEHMLASLKILSDIRFYKQFSYSTLLYFYTIPFIIVIGKNVWAFFSAQATLAILLLWGIWKTSKQLYDSKTAFICTLLCLCTIKLNANVRNFFIEPLLAAIFIWQYYYWLKSHYFTKLVPSVTFAVLHTAGMYAKSSYLPIYEIFFLLWCSISISTKAIKETNGLKTVIKTIFPFILCISSCCFCTTILSFSYPEILLIGITGFFLLPASIKQKESNKFQTAFIRFVSFISVASAIGAYDCIFRMQKIPHYYQENIRYSITNFKNYPYYFCSYLKFIINSDLYIATGLLFIIGSCIIIAYCFLKKNQYSSTKVIFLSIILPVSITITLLTFNKSRYYTPLLGFECIIAGFWLSQKRYFAAILIIAAYLQITFLTGWIFNIPIKNLYNAELSGDERCIIECSTPKKGSEILKSKFEKSHIIDYVIFTSPPVKLYWTTKLHDFIDSISSQNNTANIIICTCNTFPYNAPLLCNEIMKHLYCKNKLSYKCYSIEDINEINNISDIKNTDDYYIIIAFKNKEDVSGLCTLISNHLHKPLQIYDKFTDHMSYKKLDLLFLTSNSMKQPL
ncbi:MAG: hypothetical protein K6G50_13865 [bacterium]|nr:hypothetical protein [bacterium]